MDPIPSRDPPSLAADLAGLAALVRSCGPEFEPAADRLDALDLRLDAGSFHLAVLGQFKRGKSTLLNALLGEAVLPSSVVPLTAIPTRIRAGSMRQVRVDFSDGRTDEVPAVPDAAALAAVDGRKNLESGGLKQRLHSHADHLFVIRDEDGAACPRPVARYDFTFGKRRTRAAHGQTDPEQRSFAGFARYPDGASVRADDSVDGGQPQPAADELGGEEWIEYSLQHLPRHAASGIAHSQLETVSRQHTGSAVSRLETGVREAQLDRAPL
mgnify:CR=1 FL=1